MFIEQSSLGNITSYKNIKFDHFQSAIVVSNKNYKEKNKIEVMFDDKNMPGGVVETDVIESISVTPEEGDMVLIGFLHGYKNNPLCLGFFKDLFKRANHIKINKNEILIQKPILDEEKDLKEFTVGDDISKRGYVKISKNSVIIFYPVSGNKFQKITLNSTGIKIEGEKIELDANNIEIIAGNLINIDSDSISISAPGGVTITVRDDDLNSTVTNFSTGSVTISKYVEGSFDKSTSLP